jgi:hypothetical protein
MMAALLSFFLPLARAPGVSRHGRPKIGFVELAAAAWRAAAQIMVFLWASLALSFLSVIAAGLLFA